MKLDYMGQDGEANELYAFIANRGNLWASVETYYRIAERAKLRGEYVSEYLESDLQGIVAVGARCYLREYMPRKSQVNDYFSFLIRRSTAMLIVNNFESEIEAGNSWL